MHLIFDHADLNVKIDELGKLTGYKYFPSKHVWQRDSEPTASEPKKQKVCGKCIHSQEIKEPAEREFDTPVSGYCL